MIVSVALRVASRFNQTPCAFRTARRRITWLRFVDSLGRVCLGLDVVSLLLFRCLGCIHLGYRSTAALPEAQNRVPALSGHDVDSLQLLEMTVEE